MVILAIIIFAVIVFFVITSTSNTNVSRNPCGFDPRKLSIGSGKKANWVCAKGHKWPAPIYDRARRGLNCPYCSNKKVLPAFNIVSSAKRESSKGP